MRSCSRRFSTVLFLVFCGFIASGNLGFCDTVFYDDFENDLIGWYQWYGHASAVDGDMQITLNGAGNGVMRMLGLNLETTSIRSQGRLLDSDASLSLVVRHRPEDPHNGVGSYWGGILSDGTVGLLYGGANAHLVDESQTDLVPLEEDVLLQIDAVGNTVSLWAWRPGEAMPIQPQVQLVDTLNSQPYGDIALASFSEGVPPPSASALFRYVHVADAHLSDVRADFNGDGGVDGADLAAWQAGFGTPVGAPHADGDYNGDGDVDGNDFLGWQLAFGTSGGGAAASGAIPEPGGLTLGGIGLVVGSVCCRRRSKASSAGRGQ